MLRVVATAEFKNRNLRLAETGRIMEPGEEFVISEERYQILSGNNKYRAQFVVLLQDHGAKTETNIPTNTQTVNMVEPTPVIDEVVEETEIFVIEPGRSPVKVDSNLQPIKKTKKKKSTNN